MMSQIDLPKLEAAAKAILEVRIGKEMTSETWGKVPEPAKDSCRDAARAAFAVFRNFSH